MVRDSASHCIDNVLYRIDDDLPFMALDFAMAHVPSFVDTSCYSKFENLLTPHAVDSMMAVNYETVMNDETGSATQMVSTDPLGLRNVLAGSLGFGKKDTGSSAGFTIIDSHLFCADSTVALAFVSPALTAFDTRASSQLVGEIESLAEEFTQLHPDSAVPVVQELLVYTNECASCSLRCVRGIGLHVFPERDNVADGTRHRVYYPRSGDKLYPAYSDAFQVCRRFGGGAERRICAGLPRLSDYGRSLPGPAFHGK